MRVLAGDVGGTKTRLAIFEVSGGNLQTLSQRNYPSREYKNLDEIVQAFLAQQSVVCDQACFGIAGPIIDQRVATTNLPWEIDARALSKAFELERVSLINDLEANAWGISALSVDDFSELQAGHVDAGGNASIIAAGTGLGQAGLYWDGRRFKPFASEGGHSGFSPGSDIEIELLKFLRQRYGHVSWERVVSGMGLINIYEFLCVHRSAETPAWLRDEMTHGDAAASISNAAIAEKDELCVEALDLFIHLYGVEAGNHALKMMATGGVYIGGGIAPKLLDQLKRPLFIDGFLDKGRMRPLLEGMRVRVILNDHTALYGPALYLGCELS